MLMGPRFIVEAIKKHIIDDDVGRWCRFTFYFG